MVSTSKELKIRYTADTSGVKKGVSDIDRMHSSLGSKLKSVGAKLSSVGKSATLGLTLPIVGAGVAAFKMADDYGDAAATVQQHIKTMGVAGQVSFKGLADAARSFSMQTGIAQTELLGASGTLVTFANVAQRGTGFINETTKAAADLSASGFGSIHSASVMLGKALDNPVKGLTALTRVGVSFSDKQAAVITKLMETGQTAKAQGIILSAVQSQIGGTAKKIADPWDKAKAALQAAAITMGQALVPIISTLSKVVAGLASWFQKLSPSAQKVAVVIALIAAAVGPVLIILGKLSSAIGTIAGLFAEGGVFAGAAFFPWVAIAAAVALLAVLIIKNWSKIKGFILPVLTAIKDVALAVWEAIKTAALAVWNAIGPIVKTALAVAGAYLKAWFTVAKAVFDAIIAVAKAAFPVIVAVAKVAWTVISGVVKVAFAIIRALIGAYLAYAKGVFTVVATVAKVAWKVISGAVKIAWTIIKAVVGAYLAYAKAVFHTVATVAKAAWKVITAVVRTSAAVLKAIAGAIKAVFVAVWAAVKAVATTAWKAITAVIRTEWNGIKAVGNAIKTFFGDVWTRIKDVARTVWSTIAGIVKGAWDGVSGYVRGAANVLITALNGVIRGINVLIRGINLVKPGSDIPSIGEVPALARGGRILAGGMAVVGERGRELVNLPAGASVTPLRGGGGGELTLNLDRRRFGRGLELEMLTRGR